MQDFTGTYKMTWGPSSDIHKLGQGVYGTVTLIQHLPTRRLFACKKFRALAGPDDHAAELQRADLFYKHPHPNVMGAHSVALTDSAATPDAIIFHHADETLDHRWLRQEGVFEAKWSRKFISQLLQGLRHIHMLRIVHRDLKPDNLLLSYSLEGVTLQLTDWGWSRELPDGTSPGLRDGVPGMTPGVCSEPYRPPEVWAALPYDTSLDVWAAGVIAQELLLGYRWREVLDTSQITAAQLAVWMSSGELQLQETRMPRLLQELRAARPVAMRRPLHRGPAPNERGLSLVSRMVSIDPGDRIKASEAAEHIYIVCRVRLWDKGRGETPCRVAAAGAGAAASRASMGAARPLAGAKAGAAGPDANPKQQTAAGKTQATGQQPLPLPAPSPGQQPEEHTTPPPPPPLTDGAAASTSRLSRKRGAHGGQPACNCPGACGLRGQHLYAQSDNGTKRRIVRCVSNDVSPETGLCSRCCCRAEACASARKKGDYCHRHRAKALPWIFQVVAKLWPALELMWPMDLRTYVDSVGISKPAIAILAAQLWEPIGVMAFTNGCRGETSPAALRRGLREAVLASDQARAENQAEYVHALKVLSQGGVHLYLGVCAVATRFGVLKKATSRTKAKGIITLGLRDSGHASVQACKCSPWGMPGPPITHKRCPRAPRSLIITPARAQHTPVEPCRDPRMPPVEPCRDHRMPRGHVALG